MVCRQIRMLTYWTKLIQSDDPLLRSTYSMLRDDVDQGNNTYNNQNWAFPALFLYFTRCIMSCDHMDACSD